MKGRMGGGWSAWWLPAGPALVLVLACCLPAGAQKPAPGALKSVTAGRFVLVDGQGRERGKLGMDGSGQPRLELIDAQGVSRVVIRLDADGAAAVRLCDARGSVRVAGSVEGGGGAALAVGDPAGRMAMMMADGGAAGLQVAARGDVNWMRSAGPDGEPAAKGD